MKTLKAILATTLLVTISVWHSAALSHTPICDCYDNGDETITCEGGFSDGGSAKGIEIHVVNVAGKVLIQGAMDDYSSFTFDKPVEDYVVRYLAGEGHVIEVDGRDIEY